MKKNIGFALVSSSAKPGKRVTVNRKGSMTTGTLTELPFL